MTDQGELATIARTVIDTNSYLTLGTADEHGRPWVSPVYFVAGEYRDFYWASKTDTVHSRNLALRPQVSIVIFDSGVPVYQGRAVFADAIGEELSGPELDAGIEIYNGPAAGRGASVLAREDVLAPAPYRLYRARASRLYTLDPEGHDLRVPIDL